MADEQSRVYPLTAEEREALSIANGTFRRGFDTINLGAGDSAYWQVVIPVDTPSALLARVLTAFEGGGIVYRVFTSDNATGSPTPTPIQKPDAFGEVTFQRVTGISEAGVTVPPATNAQLLQAGSPSDLDFVPEAGSGNNASGGSAGGQAFRPQPPGAIFYLHAYNGAAQPRTLTVELTWCVGKYAVAEINKSAL